MSTILIVDDRPTNREFLTTLLNYGGHRLFEAGDGAEALRLVREERPDLVISDILMPTMDGFEFAKSVRAEPAIANTKIVFYTATYRAQEARLLATACGVSTVIAKPADPQRVLDVVNEQLGIPAPRSIPQTAIKPPAQRQADSGEPSRLDGLVDRGLEPEQERDRLRGISTTFAQNLTKLHTTTARLYALVELGMDLSAERDPQRLLQTFASAAWRIIGCQSVLALLLHATEHRKQYAATDGVAPQSVSAMEPVALDEGLVGQLLAAHNPIRLVAAQGEQSVRGLPAGHPAANSLLGVAIRTEARCYGFVLCADKLGATSEFSEEDEQLAQALATQLAIIYENFELYDVLQRHAAELQVEVGRREQVQAALTESERGLHRAQVVARLGHVITGPDGTFESWSENLPQLAGADADLMPRSTREWLDILHPEDRDGFRAKSIEAAVTGRRAEVEYRLRRPDGTWIDIRQFIEPLPPRADSKRSNRWFSTLQDITDQKSAEGKLRESERRFRQLAENIQEVFFLMDPANTQMLYVSPVYEEIWGRSVASLYENPLSWTDPIHPDDRERVFATFESTERTGRLDYEYRIVRPDGAVRWIRARGFPIRDDAGKLYRVAGVAEDITEHKLAEVRIRKLNRVYAVLSGINTLIVRAHDRDELFREACRIAVKDGQFRMAWIGLIDPDSNCVKPVAWDGEVRGFLDSAPLVVTDARAKGQGLAWRTVREKRPVISNDIQNDTQTSMKEQCEERGINSLVMLPLIVGDEGMGVVALYAAELGFFDDEEMKLLVELAGDISFALDHLQKAEKLNYLAYYDELTGLANRTLFHERLSQHVSAASAGKTRVAVIIMDIERFKTINDTLGRQAGDALLKQVAARMTRYATDPARLARIGADHFAVVVPDVQNEDEFARRTETRMQEFFGEPFRLGDTELRISASAGIAMFPNDGADAETLFRNAEAALKKAKAGGDKFLFYTQQMTERVAGKLALENKLRQALENDEFVLHYQPKVSLETGTLVGVEALIRWQSPDQGLVPPGRFIPLLEETGLILPVGAWALKQAARDHRAWVEQGIKAPRIAVNVSAIQLRQRDFVRAVEQAILEGLAPTGIDLEITESLVMEDVAGNIEKLEAVRGLGMSIAIDDFGTGYSSLGYLAKLPVQSLKIDRSFIANMQQDPNAMTLVSTMISLAHSLRLKVVAEGVETEEQANFLRLLRCDEMQGYLFSKPLPEQALVEMLRSRP